ncbi:MAG: Trm112 family protein [Phycisphaerae bacterium]|jgi:uncharacterized protein YbaR (Trm112 family)
MPPINAQLLELLVCPVPECRGKLVLQDGALRCEHCRRRYRIEGDWPVLIPEEAELTPEARS